MTTAEIRAKFLNYFVKNGHTAVESSPLVPQNDPTLLFTTAGMVQFKDVFLGKDPRPYTRAASSQKCVRAGGKHNDLENVGFTARHHTFFEMLGNFSFGDYFKKEAIRLAWGFVTEELKLPKDKLYVTVFETDDEAAEIWHHQEGVPRDRIYRFGEKDNFWSMGDTGPCGPCSELFIDRGEKYGCGKPTCQMGCDCDRYMEFWNLVFMQFNRDASGAMTPLPKPSVDTGAGLERIASIVQDVETNYDTDGFHQIIEKTAVLARMPYEGDLKFPFRVIADHSRATTFLISDGVMPSNEGRGYVLRRIMRRAIRYGKKLGLNTPFLHKTAGFVIDQMKTAYPDLVDKRAFIERAILAEEEQFFRTLEKGLALLEDETGKLQDAKTLAGEVAFKLYDTYGFPLDLTRVICSEKNISVDEAGFTRAMEQQRAESRKHWKGSGQESLNEIYLKLAAELRDSGKLPQFVGYEKITEKGQCLAILKIGVQGLERVTKVEVVPGSAEPLEVEVVFAKTPFYGESGGQVGDRGRLLTGDGVLLGEVIDVQKPTPELIISHVRLTQGTLQTDEVYTQEVDPEIRALTARNHTATHLLHWALGQVLGKHVKQAGSVVTPELLRFDFTHFQPLTREELRKIEDLINQKIWHDSPVKKQEMAKEEAIAAGAIAFFGEKYGDRVRVVQVGEFSTELCGGTHVDRSGEINLFKIQSESGIAAGVRRMIAYTSHGAFALLRKDFDEIAKIRDFVKANSNEEILSRIERMNAQEKALRKQIEQLQAKSAGQEVDQLIESARTISGGRLVSGVCVPDTQGVQRLRDISDRIKQKYPDAVIVLGMKEPQSGKAFILIAVGPQAPKEVKANELLGKITHHIQGKGGGKPDMAQAGGTAPEGLEAALRATQEILQAK